MGLGKRGCGTPAGIYCRETCHLRETFLLSNLTIIAKMKTNHEVPASQLRWHCNPKYISVKTTNDVKPTKEIIGQERALRALRLGLEMKHPGYNVFVTGFSGTGRMTTIKRLLSEFEQANSNLRDRCYVHNFKNHD